jgi:hypothetical protein
MHYICIEDFTYLVFLIFEDIGVFTVYVMSNDLRMRSRSWLTHGVTTVSAVYRYSDGLS